MVLHCRCHRASMVVSGTRVSVRPTPGAFFIPSRKRRFEVVYNLLSTRYNSRIRGHQASQQVEVLHTGSTHGHQFLFLIDDLTELRVTEDVNQKTGGYRIGQKTIQKAKAHPSKFRSGRIVVGTRRAGRETGTGEDPILYARNLFSNKVTRSGLKPQEAG
ncbi:NADH dehydrogenase [ubiquinone] iron-sulfur protein 3 [Apostasia shenzhenica]|uniref:NADH dehydrogenase [ubiquinone] iron-sulfur protein 3 n=1 Tax=Apostasia shenzhenica TaxID=1088818 RepID=A0A2H9ZSL7_9ASPA|nr:NADH dehydrogenase [ubiquinone] iron-sulfur protein 3 [Apostasia shenzhenica]